MFLKESAVKKFIHSKNKRVSIRFIMALNREISYLLDRTCRCNEKTLDDRTLFGIRDSFILSNKVQHQNTKGEEHGKEKR